MSDPVTLIDNVTAWLSEHGYPLEMDIARTLQAAGFSVTQSEYFEDPETGVLRETDVVAYLSRSDKGTQAAFAVVVECKSGKSKPWVLFTEVSDYPPNLGVGRRASTDEGKSILRTLSLRKEIKDLDLFRLPSRTGYSLTTALRKGDAKDVAYEALMSVSKAALGVVARLSSVAVHNLIPVAWPIVVIEAPLLEAFLEETGEVTVREIEHGLLIWRNPVLDHHTLVEIRTRDNFVHISESQYRDGMVLSEAVLAESKRRQDAEQAG